MEVFRHQTFVKRKKRIEINQITISSCIVYISGEYYTMDRALRLTSHIEVLICIKFVMLSVAGEAAKITENIYLPTYK